MQKEWCQFLSLRQGHILERIQHAAISGSDNPEFEANCCHRLLSNYKLGLAGKPGALSVSSGKYYHFTNGWNRVNRVACPLFVSNSNIAWLKHGMVSRSGYLYPKQILTKSEKSYYDLGHELKVGIVLAGFFGICLTVLAAVHYVLDRLGWFSSSTSTGSTDMHRGGTGSYNEWNLDPSKDKIFCSKHGWETPCEYYSHR